MRPLSGRRLQDVRCSRDLLQRYAEQTAGGVRPRAVAGREREIGVAEVERCGGGEEGRQHVDGVGPDLEGVGAVRQEVFALLRVVQLMRRWSQLSGTVLEEEA